MDLRYLAWLDPITQDSAMNRNRVVESIGMLRRLKTTDASGLLDSDDFAPCFL
jgi:hypothetical protein